MFSLIWLTVLDLTKHVSRYHGGFIAGFILWARIVSHRSNFIYVSLRFLNFRCFFIFNVNYVFLFKFLCVSVILFVLLWLFFNLSYFSSLTKYVPRFRGGFIASFILWARCVSHRSNFLYVYALSSIFKTYVLHIP